jgi:hypothetical protein
MVKRNMQPRHKADLGTIAEAMGVDPFKILLLFAKGDRRGLNLDGEVPLELRLAGAKEAVKYLHPALKAVERSSGDGEIAAHLAMVQRICDALEANIRRD